MTQNEHPLTLNAGDGHEITGRVFIPAAPTATLIISHGMAEHGDNVDALILSATNRIDRGQLLASRSLIGLIRLVRGKRHRSHLVARMTFEKFNRMFRPNRTGAYWLSRDLAQVDRYIADPLCGFECTVGLWWDFIGGMLRLSPAAYRKDLPVHLFSGTADAVGEIGRGVRRHFQAIREAGAENVTLRLFEGGRHEMLNEANREEVWDYLRSLCLTSESRLGPAHPVMSPKSFAINE